MDVSELVYKAVLVVCVFGLALFVAMYSTYAERKIAAFLQDRLGPNRAGPFGIFQPLADGVKMFMKEEVIPGVSNKWLFILGPSIAMITALITSTVIPSGNELTINVTFYPIHITVSNI